MVEEQFVIFVIYGKCNKGDRRDLWHCLENIASLYEAWLIGGDFNIARSLDERLGGNPIDFNAANEFNDFIFKCGLLEFNCLVSALTWKKSSQCLWQKLDRMLCNIKQKMIFTAISIVHLNREFSDHAPLVGRFKGA